MRLIDADELRLSHCKECTLYPDKCLKDNCDWGSIYHIDIMPTIDAIPIKQLKEWQIQYGNGCTYGTIMQLVDEWEKGNNEID